MEEVETCTSQLVELIRVLIDQLRGVTELPNSVQQQNRQPKQEQRTDRDKKNSNSSDETRTDTNQNWEDLSFKVAALNSEIQEKLDSVNETCSWQTNTHAVVAVETAESFSSSGGGGGGGGGGVPWNFVVNNIIYPLLFNLGRCYSVLDSIASEHDTLSQSPPPQHQRKKQGKAPLKPKPPPGMLSLQNYTDIALLLEVAVCIGILPHLDLHVRPPIEYRIRSLPRSLSGRAPIVALRQTQSPSHSQCTGTDDGDGDTAKQQLLRRRWLELQYTTAFIGNIIFLERFRHMLLPRHLADIYAALLQSEIIAPSLDSRGKGFDNVASIPMIQPIKIELLEDTGLLSTSPSLAARAFQELLLHGRKGPVWLRRRVSLLLNHLSTTRLEAVLDVFVLAASDDDMTAAALRLARALTLVVREKGDCDYDYNGSSGTTSVESHGKNHDQQQEYYTLLAAQLLRVLDRSIQQVNQKFEAATLDFLWMTIEHLPDGAVEAMFRSSAVSSEPFTLETATATAIDSPYASIRQTVRRIEKLLSMLPTVVDRSRFCRLVLWHPVQYFGPGNSNGGGTMQDSADKPTLVGTLLRFCSAPTVLKDDVKSDALRALRRIVEFMAFSTFVVSDSGTVDGIHVVVVSLIYSLVPTYRDVAQLRFRSLPSHLGQESESDGALPGVAIYNHDSGPGLDMATAVSAIEQNAAYAIREIVMPLWSDRDDQSTSDTSISKLSNIPSLLLEFLLVVFLRFGDPHSTTNSSQLHSKLWLTTMVVTPLLCEICPMDSLVSGENGQCRLLSLIRVVLESLTYFQDGIGSTETTSTRLASTRAAFERAEQVVAQFFNCAEDAACPWMVTMMNNATVTEFATSLALILLNMLACILELGSSTRSIQEENEIAALVGSLEALARVESIRRREGMDYSLWAEINEAASHILVLIALRKQRQSSSSQIINLDAAESTVMKDDDPFTQACSDLKSHEAPIRARGIALLRQIIVSRESTTEKVVGGQKLHTTQKEVGEQRLHVLKDFEAQVGDQSSDILMDDLFILLVRALADSESYVYLAAVHTLSVMSSSRHFFPIVMQGITNGEMVVSGHHEALSLDQRVKCTEVAITVLRRFPSALHDHSARVFDMLLFGNSELSTSSNKALEIHRSTLDYFEGARVDSSAEANVDDWHEKKIRLNTGGPLYKVEEPDLVRSALLCLATETAILVHPAQSARYCAGLLDCCMISLSLESSRLIRRSGALLAYSLYAAVVREMEEVIDQVSAYQGRMARCPMTLAMIKSGEDVLASILRRNRLGANDGQHYPDPATVARCEEALSMRDRADKGGMLAAGHMGVERARHDSFLAHLIAST